MCSCSPMMVAIHKAAHLITALAAINIGATAAFDFNFVTTYVTSPNAVMTLNLIVGAAGVISLLMCVMAMTHGCKCMDKSGCRCMDKGSERRM